MRDGETETKRKTGTEREREKGREGSEMAREEHGSGERDARNLRASVLRLSWGVAALHTVYRYRYADVLGRRSNKGYSTLYSSPPRGLPSRVDNSKNLSPRFWFHFNAEE